MRKNWEFIVFQHLQRRLVEQAPRLLRHPQAGALPAATKPDGGPAGQGVPGGHRRGEFAFLAGKWLKVEVSDLGLCWFISEREGKLVVARKCEHADVCFSGNSQDLVLIAGRREDPDSLFFQRRLKIEGIPSWAWR